MGKRSTSGPGSAPEVEYSPMQWTDMTRPSGRGRLEHIKMEKGI